MDCWAETEKYVFMQQANLLDGNKTLEVYAMRENISQGKQVHFCYLNRPKARRRPHNKTNLHCSRKRVTHSFKGYGTSRKVKKIFQKSVFVQHK